MLAPIAVHAAWRGGNLTPWAVLQFGGMALVLGLAALPARNRAMPLRLGLVIAAYAAAKLVELADHAIFDATGGLIAGHALKHVLASLAALPVILPFLTARRSGQNGARSSAVPKALAQARQG